MRAPPQAKVYQIAVDSASPYRLPIYARWPWPGTEFVLVCARRDKPVVRQEIEALLGAGRPLPTLPGRVILRMGLDGVEASGPSGLRSISGPVASDLSAALSPLRMLQRKLRGETSFHSAIAFPHVAD